MRRSYICLRPSQHKAGGQHRLPSDFLAVQTIPVLETLYNQSSGSHQSGGYGMYGTIARLKVKPGMEGQLLEEIRAEAEQAHMPGYIQQFLYRMDSEPDTYYLVVIFADKDSYVANANHPEQHERYLKLVSMLTAEPEWHDGDVVYPPTLTR
jgi:heme-degrading monooxygenase HmoA